MKFIYVILLLALLLLVGFLTPICTLLLLLVHDYAFDAAIRTSTLGSDVLQMLLVFFLLLPVGTQLSADQWLLQNNGWSGRIVHSIYRPLGPLTPEKVSILRFLTFVTFGAVSLYAALTHIHDRSWWSGVANLYVLSSSYMSKAYLAMDALLDSIPIMALLFSIVSTYIQLAWESTMIPLVFSRYGRVFVIWWGILFFVISAFVLQLGWLAYYELILWAMLFGRAPKIPSITSRLVRVPHAQVLRERLPGLYLLARNIWRPTALTSSIGTRPLKLPRVFQAALLCYCLYFVLYLAFLPPVAALPVIRDLRGNPEMRAIYRAVELFGLTPLDVFNDTDLRMSENYFTLTRIGVDGSRELLPYTGYDGNRLEWHDSDRIYFGNSLLWRRLKLGRPDICYDNDIDPLFVGELVQLDQHRSGNIAATYELRYYHRPLPDLELLQRWTYAVPPTTLVCTVLYEPQSNAARIVSRPATAGERH